MKRPLTKEELKRIDSREFYEALEPLLYQGAEYGEVRIDIFLDMLLNDEINSIKIVTDVKETK